MTAPSLTQLLIGLFGFSGETNPQKEQSPADTGLCEKEENSTMVLRNDSSSKPASTHASRTAQGDDSPAIGRLVENVKILPQPTWGKDPQHAGRPYIEYVDITPQLATELLDKRNANNREIVRARVELYAGMMARGKWTIASESIAINQEGELCNGQHRLSAIVLLNEPVAMEVKWNVPGNVGGGYDQGLNRPAWVNAQLAGGKRDALSSKQKSRMQEIVSSIRIGFSNTKRICTDEYVALCTKYGQALKWFLSIPDQHKIPASVAGAIVFSYQLNPEVIHNFTVSYIGGENGKKGTPWFMLREQIPLRRHGRSRSMSQGEVFRRTCNAIVNTLDRKKIQSLRDNDAHLIVDQRLAQMKGKK